MINFLSPNYLYGLLLLAIPVIIHLFNFRRYKKVLFTNVRFLQELKEETTRTSRLKHLLILASRLLAMLFIILAFAQPFIPSGEAGPTNSGEPVSIYIDNSFSMDAVSSEGPLLEVARKKAREIANSFPATTRFQLLTNDFSAIQQRLISKDDFLDEVERVKLSPYSRSLTEVVLRQKEAFVANNTNAARTFLISDFQESTSNFSSLQKDSSIRTSLVALPLQSTGNIYIDSCWLSGPLVQLNQPAEISVKLINSSEKDAESVPVKLLINGSQKAVTSVSVPAGQSFTTTFSFTISSPGWQQAEVRITDHPITFDDSYYSSFEVREKFNVLAIHDGTPMPYLEALFSSDPSFNFKRTSTGNVDYTILNQTSLVILDDVKEVSTGLSEELRKFLDAGGSLCVFPDSSITPGTYNAFLQQIGADAFSGLNENADKVQTIDLQHPLFTEVFEAARQKEANTDYPMAAKHFDFASNSGSRQVLMKLQGGGAFLSAYTIGKGNLYLFAVPLSPGFSNVARHAVIVPVLYRMAVLSVRPLAFANVMGRARPVELNLPAPGGDEAFHLINESLKTDIIPAVKPVASGIMVDAGEQVSAAGHFQLKKGKETIAVLSFNNDRKESQMTFLTESKLEEQASATGWNLLKASLPDLTKTLTVQQRGIPLWKYAVVLALIFLLIETLLIRFWKTT